MFITQNVDLMTTKTPVIGFAQKVFRPHKKERGQARLPNFELIRLEVLIDAGEAFSVSAFTQPKSLEVGKVGLPPLFSEPNTLFVQNHCD
jgi:hypothetical protein